MSVQFGTSILSWVTPQWTAESGKIAIQKTAQAGFDLLEILLPPSMDIDTQATRQQLKAQGIGAVCSLNLPAHCHIAFYPKEATKLIRMALQKTADLDTDFLGGVLHGGIGVFSGQPRTESETQIICQVWAEVADYARTLGIRIGIEPINRYETYVCTAAAEVLDMIGRVNSPQLGLHLDTFHMNIEEDNFYDPIAKAAERLWHLHITESHRGMLGEGNVHWDDLFRGLADVGYKGALVLENFSNSIDGMASAVSLWRKSPYDADTLARQSLAFMQAKAAEYGL